MPDREQETARLPAEPQNSCGSLSQDQKSKDVLQDGGMAKWRRAEIAAFCVSLVAYVLWCTAWCSILLERWMPMIRGYSVYYATRIDWEPWAALIAFFLALGGAVLTASADRAHGAKRLGPVLRLAWLLVSAVLLPATVWAVSTLMAPPIIGT